ncbi:dUTP diphosphatase [Spiroplasma endosymbiont of Amphibalanus improvisus]|uniref:dUTP diphosphatase n=1 Tax=Spiroplasma endosymbiont of Amphibalanus improvisus TaxID=3066327 RepID=UPI00313F2CAF
MLSQNFLEQIKNKQANLDNFIFEKSNTSREETVQKRQLAFIIELSEFINEQRDFKYWSKKPTSDKDILLEEYVDGLHFLISIANDIEGLDFSEFKFIPIKWVSLTKLYLDCYNKFMFFTKNVRISHYFILLNSFLNIGYNLKFDEDIIIKHYERKNKINFQRQENNY